MITISQKLVDKYIHMAKLAEYGVKKVEELQKVNEYLFSLLTKRQLDKFIKWEESLEESK